MGFGPSSLITWGSPLTGKVLRDLAVTRVGALLQPTHVSLLRIFCIVAAS
jgi:hypothetical protein